MEYDHSLTSFERLNSFKKLDSKCQYNSTKTCHYNKKLNTLRKHAHAIYRDFLSCKN